MSQYNGYPQQGYSQDQSTPAQPASPSQQDSAPNHHHKRRQYPTQQYDFNASPATPAYPGAPGYGGGPSPQTSGGADAYGAGQGAQGAVFTPAMANTTAPAISNAMGYNPSGAGAADALASQFGRMNVGGAPGVAPGQAPAYGTQQDPSTTRLPLNQIYNLDLLTSLPPPISDLSLPPPPIILPPNATCTQSPNSNASPDYMRLTLNVIPSSHSLLKKSKLPLALVVRPYNALLNASENIPVIDDSEISRCRRCRCYINPFVQFVNNDFRWKCNICGLSNDVPSKFSYNPMTNMRTDIWSRSELNCGVVDFIAPSGYMVRAPQPPVYVFVLDVSIHAIQNGLLATAARAIKENLDRLPNKGDRCKVGFIAVDSALHFFDLSGNSEDSTPSMLVVSELDNPFLPSPSGLLVNLTESKKQIESLLDNMGSLFARNSNPNNALGSALNAAHQLIANIGGKVICLSASLPNVGIAKLEVREDRKNLGTSKENALLQTANSFYKSFAIECNRSQVSIDMFLFSSHYQDVASLSNLPRFTGGQTYFYPGWNASRPEDAIKLAHELGQHMSMEDAFEAVLRVRASTELRMSSFYGNFFNRSSDLCSFPAFPRDQSYVIEVSIDETISKPWITFQAAVLHSTCEGERRIRVITLSVPTSSALQDIYASADQLAISAYLTQKACEKALSSGLTEAREFVENKMLEILQTYKKELMTTNVGSSAPLQFCANLRMLPLLVNAIVKSIAFRKSAQIASDLRSAAICLLSTLPVKYLVKYLHPDFFSLHDMPDEAGLPDDTTGEIALPPKINLSSERIVSHGLYLIHDGQTMFLWVGRDAVPQLIVDAFGVESKELLPNGKAEVPETDSPLNQRIRAIISKLREKKDNITWPSLFIVREDGDASLRLWASTFLIEDRTDQGLSYYQFLTGLRDKLNS